MKCRWIPGVALVGILLGCKSPPAPIEGTVPAPVPAPPRVRAAPTPEVPLQPLTPALVGRVKEENIPHFQYYISDGVTLQKERHLYNEVISNGEAVFTDSYIKDVVIIHPETKGIVVKVRWEDGQMILDACFEQDDKLTLQFNLLDEDGYFYLKAANGETISYGYEEYQIYYAEEVLPFLLIRLDSKAFDTINSRVVSGRSVNP